MLLEERRRLKNAVIIQSFIRGYRDRKQQYSIQRSAFDRCTNLSQSGGAFSLASGPNLTLLVRQLLFFYKQNEDSKRLTWTCRHLIKHGSAFVQQLGGSDRLTCLFQIKRLLGLCCRLLQNCNDDSLNVALPMRMLEVFSSENTYLPVLQDASYVVSVIEQILHYMIQNGYFERQQVFTAFTKEVLAAPFTEQIFHLVIPALADVQTAFPYEPFLNALLSGESGCPRTSGGTPWLFYFVLTVGENYLGTLSEEGLLVYLRVLQTFLSQLPVSPANASCQDSASDSEDESEETDKQASTPEDGRLSVPYITEECLKKLDTKQQTNTLLNLVWRDSASEEAFTLMAGICHTLMVQHRVMVPKARQVSAGQAASARAVRPPLAQACSPGGLLREQAVCGVRADVFQMVSETSLVPHIFYDNTDDHRPSGEYSSVPLDLRKARAHALDAALEEGMLRQLGAGESMVPLLQVISRGSPMSFEDSSRIIPLFYLFSSLFSHSLISIHDNEFFGDPMEEMKEKKHARSWIPSSVVGQRPSSMMPFTLEELVILSRCLRDACLGIIKLAYPETKPEVREEYVTAFRSVGVTTSSEMQRCMQMEQKRWIQLFKVITNLVKMLKSRDTRRSFCPPNHWLSEQEDIKADKVLLKDLSSIFH
ncbi:Ubiquitin-protein ligase E3C [Camelus dromedarius]|uniref:HECT-type E3 ubiquitin transferase n=1 Tax=Camelus dromedarius TaxID=9838 RepID=A0A5N4DXJ2_CAMDR|nr:Ubiquitin-protein ligase E3C [Camelus dromedarius]